MKIGCLGLGNMGSALARAFVAAGHEVTGWSRSEPTRHALESICPTTEDICEAVVFADLIVVCLPDSDVTIVALEPVAGSMWHNRTFVQLSSGGAKDARRMDAWAGERGVAFIDGAIATFPDRVGTPTAAIFLSGNRPAYEQVKDVLAALGGRNAFVSDDVTGAAAMDLAWLSVYYGNSLGLLHGAAFCQSHGLDPSLLFGAMPSFLPEISHAAREYDGMIAKNDFTGNQAALYVHLAAMEHLSDSARQVGMDSRFTELLLAFYGQAVRDGDGDKEIAAAIKVARKQ